MNEKIFNTRIVHKHDTAENWAKAVNFVPKAGELIIYDIDENYNYPRTKIGDGVRVVEELPFIENQADWNQNDTTALDYVKNKPIANGAGENSTCLHTGPINAMTKYQVVAGKYNEVDGIFGVASISNSYMGAYTQDTPIIIFNEEPVLNSYSGYFTATISLVGTIADFTYGEHYFVLLEDLEQSTYEVGQTITFTKYRSSNKITSYRYVDTSRATSEGKYSFIIGNGSSEDERSNAHTVSWEGDAWYAGNIEGSEINGKRITVGHERKEVAKLEDVPHIAFIDLFNTYGQATFETTEYSIEYTNKGSVFRPFELEKEYIIEIDGNFYTATASSSLFKNSAAPTGGTSGGVVVVPGGGTIPGGSSTITSTLPPKDTYKTTSIGSLKTTTYAGNFTGEGDFGINLSKTVNNNNSEDVSYTYTVYLPLNTGLEHSVAIYEKSIKEVPEEIIPDTIARKADLNNLDLITIEDIDTICGSVTPISEVLF